MKGAISKKGYLKSSPDKKNDFNLVPSNKITMKGVDKELKLIPIKLPEGTMGKAVIGKPGKEYSFPGFDAVLEIPTHLMSQGGSPYSPVSQLPVLPHYNTTPQNGFQTVMSHGGAYSAISQVPVLPHYNVGPVPGFQTVMQQGGAYSPVSQLPVLPHYNTSPRAALTIAKKGGEICIPCMFSNVKEYMQDGGQPSQPQYTFDQYYKDLGAWQNPSAQHVPKTISNYQQNWIRPTILTYQQQLNAGLATKYGTAFNATTGPTEDQYLTPEEGATYVGGVDKYNDYLSYVRAYGAYRDATSGSYNATTATAGANDPSGNMYGYRHYNLYKPQTAQIQTNTAITQQERPEIMSQIPQQKEGGWIGKANDSMERKGTKGAFTDYCGGKVTDECIKRGLASSNATTRRRAAFAKAMRSIAKKKEGGEAGDYVGQDYLERKNSAFLNKIAENFRMHSADEMDMDSLHKQMISQYQDGGATLPMGTVYPVTSQYPEPYQTVDVPANPMWDLNYQVPAGGPTYENIEMDPAQLEGRPITSAPQTTTQKNWYLSMAPVQQANSLLAGTGKIANMLETAQRRKQDEEARRRLGADFVFNPTQAGAVSRGDYEPNSGMFRPNAMVPVQFPGGAGQGYGYGSYQQGGEYYMTDDQINQILRDGGEVEYLD